MLLLMTEHPATHFPGLLMLVLEMWQKRCWRREASDRMAGGWVPGTYAGPWKRQASRDGGGAGCGSWGGKARLSQWEGKWGWLPESWPRKQGQQGGSLPGPRKVKVKELVCEEWGELGKKTHPQTFLPFLNFCSTDSKRNQFLKSPAFH